MKSVINEDWGNLLLQEVKRLKGEPKSQAGNSYRWGTNKGFSVDSEKGLWQDFSTGDGGCYKDFLKIYKDTTISQYHYGNNTLKVRYQNGNGKDFRFFKKDDAGKLTFGQGDTMLMPYNFDKVNERQEVIICEGEKTVDAMQPLCSVPVLTGGGAKDIKNRDWKCIYGRQVMLCRDNDAPGLEWEKDLCELLTYEYNCIVLLAEIPGNWGEKDDFADWRHEYQEQDAFYNWCLHNNKPMSPPLEFATFDKINTTQYKEPEWLIENFLSDGDQAIFYAKAGHGKSLFTGALISNLCSGHNFAGFNVPKSKKCLLVDGEMSLPELQKRYRGYFKTIKDPRMDNLILMSVFFEDNPVSNLSLPENRQKLIKAIMYHKPEVVVLDNYFTLWSPSDHNNAECWQDEVMDLLLFLRKRGIAVIVIDHSNKGQSLFGSSVKVVTMDLVLRGEQSEKEEDLYTWHFEKARKLNSENRNSFELRLNDTEGLSFSRNEKIKPTYRLRELFDQDVSIREAETTMKDEYPYEKGFSKSSVERFFNQWTKEEKKDVYF